MKTKPYKKCPECKGTGEHKQRGGPTLKCFDCDGTGHAQKFEMIFWGYDQFPFVLASRGFLKDDGTCYVPSYNMSVRPLLLLPLTEGAAVVAALKSLEETRTETLRAIDEGFKARLARIFPSAIKK